MEFIAIFAIGLVLGTGLWGVLCNVMKIIHVYGPCRNAAMRHNGVDFGVSFTISHRNICEPELPAPAYIGTNAGGIPATIVPIRTHSDALVSGTKPDQGDFAIAA